jgi:LCP family protein required for cell wall assembly
VKSQKPDATAHVDAGEDSDPLLEFDDEAGEEASPRRRRAVRRVLFISMGVLVVLVFSGIGGLYLLSERLGDNVQRYPSVFSGLDESQRPKPPVNEAATTFLLMGTDSRSSEPTTGTGATAPDFVPGSQRSDAILLVRVAGDKAHASVVSIPRDSWVPIPGHGSNKINAAYSFGGPTLLVQTVEAMTHVRIDHFAVIDFAGFQAMTDSVGGIDVQISAPSSSRGVTFHAGLNHLNGEQALIYVRQRYDLPRGDLDRVQRQQNALRALMDKAASSGLLSNPLRTYDLVDAVSRSVGVDDSLSNGGLRSLVFDLRNMRSSGVMFMTAPVAGLGWEGSQSVVYLEPNKSSALWQAVNTDRVGDYVKNNPADQLGDSPR